MKLWELSSYFRSESKTLEQVINDPKWADFAKHFRELKQLVKRQDRSVLDMELPNELCRRALALTGRKYFLNQGHLYELSDSQDVARENILTALQVFDKYGGACLEEVREYGSWCTTPSAPK